MTAFWVLLVAFPALVFMENFYILLGVVLYVISIWFTVSVYTHYSDPLPPELQTFRDLAVLIADQNYVAVDNNASNTYGAAEGLT